MTTWFFGPLDFGFGLNASYADMDWLAIEVHGDFLLLTNAPLEEMDGLQLLSRYRG